MGSKEKEFKLALDEIDYGAGVFEEDTPQNKDGVKDSKKLARIARQQHLDELLTDWEGLICDHLNQIAERTWNGVYEKAEQYNRARILSDDRYMFEEKDKINAPAKRLKWLVSREIVVRVTPEKNRKYFRWLKTQSKNVATCAYFRVDLEFTWINGHVPIIAYHFEVFSAGSTEQVNNYQDLFDALLQAYKNGPNKVKQL